MSCLKWVPRITLTPRGATTLLDIRVKHRSRTCRWELNFPEAFLIEGSICHRHVFYAHWERATGEANLLLMRFRTKRLSIPPTNTDLRQFLRRLYSGFRDASFLSYIPLACEVLYKVSGDSVEVVLAVKNIGRRAWRFSAEAMFCFRNYRMRDFIDPTGERTFVRTNGQVRAVAELSDVSDPDRERWMIDYSQRGEQVHPRYQPCMDTLVDDGFIANASTAGEIVGCFWRAVHRVSANLQTIHCIHSNPKIAPLPSQRVVLNYGRIYLFQSSIAELAERIESDFAPQRVEETMRQFKNLGISSLLSEGRLV